jgi:N6-L-threonylcarbamoyladenine synthase
MKPKIPYTILAIESSCDETAAAVYCSEKKLLSNELFSQIDLHKMHGGVIPEIASRAHLEKIVTIVQAALDKANMIFDNIDAIAVTTKPGLPGSLSVGVAFAKSIAWAANKKIIGIDHLEGHVFSACIENNIPFPFLALTVSGGHSSIYLVKNWGDFEIIANTIDDAAGEAFDKIAKMMNLGYPGGPIIEKLAETVKFQDFFAYPRGKKKLHFSFSGLKTSVLYNLVQQGAYDLKTKKFLRDDDLLLKAQVASSLLVCMGETFKQKLSLALELYPEVKALAFVGGVACNKYLRSILKDFCEKKEMEFFHPSPKLCTDNAGMIAFVGNYKAQQEKFSDFNLTILD